MADAAAATAFIAKPSRAALAAEQAVPMHSVAVAGHRAGFATSLVQCWAEINAELAVYTGLVEIARQQPGEQQSRSSYLSKAAGADTIDGLPSAQRLYGTTSPFG